MKKVLSLTYTGRNRCSALCYTSFAKALIAISLLTPSEQRIYHHVNSDHPRYRVHIRENRSGCSHTNMLLDTFADTFELALSEAENALSRNGYGFVEISVA